MRHFLLIGYGAIGRYVAGEIARDYKRIRLSILVRPQHREETAHALGGAVEVVSRLEQLDDVPELAIECAGHGAVADFGEACLASGSDFFITSVGALTDAALLKRLTDAARVHLGKLLIPAGAIGGVDALAAARCGGLDSVRYTSRKVPNAWRGTHAEKLVDLGALTSATEFYRGTAGEAARLFPQNANVAATIALAGLGFERTEVSLNADPAAPGNIHLIEAEGAFGRMRVEMEGKPLPANPKTSTLAALSVLRTIHNRTDAIQI
jgi:aspartate dehydrogenase